MSTARRLTCWMAFVGILVPTLAVAARPGSHSGAALSPEGLDNQRRIDANQINMWVTNYGAFAWDLATGNSGLEYPKGSGKTAIFASGLWLGANVGGQIRTVVGEYSQEYGPGAMVGGTFDDPSRPEYKVYKVVRWTGNPQDSAHVDNPTPGPRADPLVHHSWSEYLLGAAPHGAPTRTYRLPDPASPGDSVDVPGPDVSGDQMLWAVYNDADPSRHTNDAGSSTPLGVEIQQSTWSFNSPDYLGYTVFLEFKIINKGSNTLEDMYVSPWSDPDLGGASDDLVGCDPSLDLGYVYNANNNDLQYLGMPPSLGFVVLQGPIDPLGDTLGMTAFSKYIGGTDPSSTDETYNYMQGLLPDGSPVIDPTTGLQTRFFNPGDPVQATGWLDINPADRRMMLSSGPFRMLPGGTQVVRYAIVVGQGSDRLASISAVKANAVALRGGPPPPPPPPPPTNCPRDRVFWGAQCGPGGADLTPAQMTSIAAYVNGRSLLFDWLAGTEHDAFCDVLNPPGPLDIRLQAKQEFAALLANFAAGEHGIEPAHGQPITLIPSTPVACAAVDAADIRQLVETATPSTTIRDAFYLDNNPAHRRALTSVNWGGAGFFGGADVGWNFWGGSLDPVASPDSFATVEVRFSSTATSKAYRYLRLERADGSAPVGGREYRYGGFRTCNFQVWDIVHNVQLDAAYTERTVTDANGTILGPGFQVATFDSTWAPTAEASGAGGREYLFILNTPYSDTPKAPFEIDDAMDVTPMPILYGLWAQLRSASDVIDDGDAFRFVWTPFAGPGADARFLELEGQPLSDPGVFQAYSDFVQCLGDINRNISLENPCDMPTPVQVSLFEANADPDRVTLSWYATRRAQSATIERRVEASPWARLAQVSSDGSGVIHYEDTNVAAGSRYGYRLAMTGETGVTYAGETWVTVPARFALGLVGFVPNPARSSPAVEFVLPSQAPARIEVFDLQGRRVASERLPHPERGRSVVRLSAGSQLRSGVYMLVLTQNGASVTKRAVIVH